MLSIWNKIQKILVDDRARRQLEGVDPHKRQHLGVTFLVEVLTEAVTKCLAEYLIEVSCRAFLNKRNLALVGEQPQ